MVLAATILAVIALAYANGANDNFKGVATLFGSGTTNYRAALTWAAVTTFLGSLTAIIFAQQLLKSFSGRGLVDDALVTDLRYVAAVALGSGLTVLLATRLGFPISTTHSLVGALVGSGWAAGSVIDISKLGAEFFFPLILAPVLAIAATCLLYPAFSFVRRRLGICRETCVCIGEEVLEVIPAGCGSVAAERAERISVSVGTTATCRSRYQGRVIGLEASRVIDVLHYLSAGIVSFARGLNDTPKIAALLLLVPALGGGSGVALVASAMAAGGILNARRVAETMSRKVTPMNHGQGLTANLITGAVVIGASRLGLPVSTTHVSCGSLFGIGLLTGQGQVFTIARILTAWLTTLPLAMALGAVCCLWLRR